MQRNQEIERLKISPTIGYLIQELLVTLAKKKKSDTNFYTYRQLFQKRQHYYFNDKIEHVYRLREWNREGMINTGQILRKSMEMQGEIRGRTNVKGEKDI